MKPSPAKSVLTVQTIVWAAIAWAVIALLFFLLFSSASADQGHPKWYQVITYILEQVAFLGASLLCLRNWRSPQIVSGSNVWLMLGIGLLLYFIGNLFFAYWELGLEIDPSVSPGDFFFIPAYLFLGWGMLQAVISRQLNLTPLQWVILIGIGALGIIVAVLAGSTPDYAVEAATAAPEALPANVPGWAAALQTQLELLAEPVQWFYIVGDVILVVMATALLLAYWGGRFSVSWRFIAAAAFCFYIADIWFNYATNYIPNYETGSLPEVFWIFSGCLFAIGAALEYDLSTRRRASRRRS